MPRKPKVTAVPVEQEPQGASEGSTEPKTDAEQMTDIINEVSTTEPIRESEYEQHYVLTTPVVLKAKAKRAPSRSPSVRKPKVIEPEVVATPSLGEVHAEVTLPVEEVKAEAKVECPDCGKLMSPKTLRYSHGLNCKANKQKQPMQNEMQSVTNEWVEHEGQRRLTADERSEQPVEKPWSPSWCRMRSDFPTHQYIHT